MLDFMIFRTLRLLKLWKGALVPTHLPEAAVLLQSEKLCQPPVSTAGGGNQLLPELPAELS